MELHDYKSYVYQTSAINFWSETFVPLHQALFNHGISSLQNALPESRALNHNTLKSNN